MFRVNPMDDISQYNIKRWRALAEANALFTRPRLDLTPTTARAMIDPQSRLGDLRGKRVLCLAGGGGQQSAAYALLGADVTVVDLSAEQLERDRQVATHYKVEIKTHQGDMRDLSALPKDTFDLVDQPYSINFVPDVGDIFSQVARIIKPKGNYRVMCANPFAAGMTERDWNGDGYTMKRPYQQGERIVYEDQEWVYDRNESAPVPRPQEFRHTLGTVINGLVENGFIIRELVDVVAINPDIQAGPGTWDHFTAVAPPWFVIYSVYRPDVFS